MANVDRTRRWPTNFGLGILNGLIISLMPALTVWSAQWAESYGVGLLNWVAAPQWISLPVTLLAWSLAQYVFHFCLHRSPILWRVHRVHHCDVHLDASSLRFHPFEMIASIIFLVPIAFLFGLPAAAIAAYEGFAIVAGLLTHMNLRMPAAIDRTARYLFVTPGLHRLHHSADPVDTESNYGNTLSIWDRLFGTLRSEPHQAGRMLRYGLDDVNEESARSFDYQLSLPWRA